MTDSRLGIHSQVFVDETTGIESGVLTGSPGEGYLYLSGDTGHLSIHLGWSPAEVAGNVDRLAAALAEIRTAAVAELGQDPATAATSYDPADGSPDPVPDPPVMGIAEGDPGILATAAAASESELRAVWGDR